MRIASKSERKFLGGEEERAAASTRRRWICPCQKNKTKTPSPSQSKIAIGHVINPSRVSRPIRFKYMDYVFLCSPIGFKYKDYVFLCQSTGFKLQNQSMIGWFERQRYRSSAHQDSSPGVCIIPEFILGFSMIQFQW